MGKSLLLNLVENLVSDFSARYYDLAILKVRIKVVTRLARFIGCMKGVAVTFLVGNYAMLYVRAALL